MGSGVPSLEFWSFGVWSLKFVSGEAKLRNYCDPGLLHNSSSRSRLRLRRGSLGVLRVASVCFWPAESLTVRLNELTIAFTAGEC